MQINVSQLLQSSIGTERTYLVDEKIDVLGDGNPYPIHGEIKLVRTNRSILVEGTLESDVELTCSRCLRKFCQHLVIHISDEFVPTIDIVTGMPVAVTDEPGVFTIDEHHVIDLSEAIRQYAVLAVPMKPLCYDDCAGLCQVCGKNLNEGPCVCPRQETDPRWAVLNRLLK